MRGWRFNFFYILLILYVFVAVNQEATALFIAFIPLLGIIGMFNFNLSLVGLLIIIPFYGYMQSPVIMPAYFLVVSALYIIKMLNNSIQTIKSDYFKRLFLLFVLSVLSSMLSAYYDHFLAVGLFLLVILFSYIISQKTASSVNGLYMVVNAIIISGLISAINALLHIQQVQESVRRLSMGDDSVRQLANAVSLALVLLVFFYFSKKGKNHKFNAAVRFQWVILSKFKWIFGGILFGVLIATVSRGVIISFFVFVMSYLFIKNLKNLNNLRFSKIIQQFVYLTMIGLFITLVLTNPSLFNDISEFFNINVNVLESRFSDSNISGGSNIRSEIWKAGLAGLDGWKPLYGHGMLSFKDLAKANGYDFYAHSVFVDILVSTGILGFFVLLKLLTSIIYRSIKLNNIQVISLLMFLILSYFSHGDMLSRGFWVFLGLLYGLTYNHEFIQIQNKKTI